MSYEDYKMNNEYISDDREDLDPCEECEDDGFSAKKKRTIEVEEVLGTGSAETIVEICIPLCPPAFEIMEDIITKKIVFDVLVASKGKVFVNGRILKDIPYKTKERSCNPSCNMVSKLTFGNIRHATAEIPFALCINVPKAVKGAKVVVLDSEVNSVEIPSHLGCIRNDCVAKCENPAFRYDPCQRKLIKALQEKDCITVKVKVVKDVLLDVPGTDANC
ncbi:MAG: hypothetical protein QME45_11380 [Clostridiales bacterium]|nr:hypothetical protein [Clostridiales bacterium]